MPNVKVLFIKIVLAHLSCFGVLSQNNQSQSRYTLTYKLHNNIQSGLAYKTWHKNKFDMFHLI